MEVPRARKSGHVCGLAGAFKDPDRYKSYYVAEVDDNGFETDARKPVWVSGNWFDACRLAERLGPQWHDERAEETRRGRAYARALAARLAEERKGLDKQAFPEIRKMACGKSPQKSP